MHLNYNWVSGLFKPSTTVQRFSRKKYIVAFLHKRFYSLKQNAMTWISKKIVSLCFNIMVLFQHSWVFGSSCWYFQDLRIWMLKEIQRSFKLSEAIKSNICFLFNKESVNTIHILDDWIMSVGAFEHWFLRKDTKSEYSLLLICAHLSANWLIGATGHT